MAVSTRLLVRRLAPLLLASLRRGPPGLVGRELPVENRGDAGCLHVDGWPAEWVFDAVLADAHDDEATPLLRQPIVLRVQDVLEDLAVVVPKELEDAPNDRAMLGVVKAFTFSMTVRRGCCILMYFMARAIKAPALRGPLLPEPLPMVLKS